MDMDSRRNGWLPWASVALLAALCGVLAVLQYQWIGEISGAERKNLESTLHDGLDSLRLDLNEQVAAAEVALQPTQFQVEELGREAAYTSQYLRWKDLRKPLFRHIALAVPDGNRLVLSSLDLATGSLAESKWPADWRGMQARLIERLRREPVGPADEASEPFLLEVPRFGAPPRTREQEWMILELDTDYARRILLPGLLARHLNGYGAEVVMARDPSVVIFRTPGLPIGGSADASVTLLGAGFGTPPLALRIEQSGRFPGGPGPMRFGRGPGGGFVAAGPPPRLPSFATGPWLLRVRHEAGSLEALVTQTRRRNLAVSGGLLLLILATVVLLVRLSRRAQQLAELQINFVAGVSHELRTPLSVIRTAAYNLRGRLAHRPEQVEQYGELIQGESEKLGRLIEQILQFASAKAGHVIRRREAVAIEAIMDQSLASSKAAGGNPEVIFEKHIAPDLPDVFADESALKQAIQNLVDNAIKHGTRKLPWVSVSASLVKDEVEIAVADRGPGIPLEEQQRIFEPFFRGTRALADQVHGTGLGLDLVKRIVEAHGGTVRVESEPGKGTTFFVRLPAMTSERQGQLAPSVG